MDVGRDGVQVLSETSVLKKSQTLSFEEPQEIYYVKFNVTLSIIRVASFGDAYPLLILKLK